MKKTKLSILVISSALALVGCYNNNFKELHPESQKACDTTNTVSYQADIKAILDANCTSCHNGGGTPSLVGYQNAVNSYPGNQLYKSLLAGASNPMPKGAPTLSAADIAKVKQWVEGCQPNGAFFNTTCDTLVAMSYSLNVLPILSANCTNGCHNAVGYGQSLLTHADVANDTFNVAVSGPPVSSLVNSITKNIPSALMPLGRAPLSACQIAKIKRWVKEGALNN